LPSKRTIIGDNNLSGAWIKRRMNGRRQAVTNDMKYPEEIRQDEILRNLERLQAKLRRREGKIRTHKDDRNDYNEHGEDENR